MDQAANLFEQVNRLVSDATLPYHLCETLYEFAELNCELKGYEEAQRINNQALEIARRIGRVDILFKAQLLSDHIRLSLNLIDPSEALKAFKELLETWTGEPEQAEIYYQIWLLDIDKESQLSGQKAAESFLSLFERTSIYHYAQRYFQLTGERLAVSDPLPKPPVIASQDPLQMNILLEQVDQMIYNEAAGSLQKI